MHCRRNPKCRARARPRRGRWHARSRQIRRSRHLEYRRARRARVSHGFKSTVRPHLESPMIAIVLKPGTVTLADWQAIYRGAVPKLDTGCRAIVERGAQAVARIVNEGKPVYGINTGFGKLASVRIDTADLARLQRNIVLSHA